MGAVYSDLLANPCVNVQGDLDEKDFLGKLVLVLCYRPNNVLSEVYLDKFVNWASHYHQHFVLAVVVSPEHEIDQNQEYAENLIRKYNLNCPVFFDKESTFRKVHSVKKDPGIVIYDQLGRRRYIGTGNIDLQAAHELCVSLMNQALKTGHARISNTILTDIPHAESRFLKFPKRITVDYIGKRIFISDTARHRIVVCDYEGKVSQVIGTGEEGDKDGERGVCQLRFPQGMCVHNNMLFIADTGNHKVKCIDLESLSSKTIVGTGVMNFHQNINHRGIRISLCHPTDVKISQFDSKPVLLISNTGSRQILKYDFEVDRVESYIGNGRDEARDDIYKMASFVQPSYMNTQIPGFTVVSDPENNNLRLLSKDNVRTLVGKREGESGDRLGSSREARVKAPTGICFAGGQNLAFMDGANKKLKLLNVKEHKVLPLSQKLEEVDSISDIAMIDEDHFLLLDEGGSSLYHFFPSKQQLKAFEFHFNDRVSEMKKKVDSLPSYSVLHQESEEYQQSLSSVEVRVSIEIPGHLEFKKDMSSRVMAFEKHMESWFLVRELKIDPEYPSLILRLMNVGKANHYVVDLQLFLATKGSGYESKEFNYRLNIKEGGRSRNRPIHWDLKVSN